MDGCRAFSSLPFLLSPFLPSFSFPRLSLVEVLISSTQKYPQTTRRRNRVCQTRRDEAQAAPARRQRCCRSTIHRRAGVPVDAGRRQRGRSRAARRPRARHRFHEDDGYVGCGAVYVQVRTRLSLISHCSAFFFILANANTSPNEWSAYVNNNTTTTTEDAGQQQNAFAGFTNMQWSDGAPFVQGMRM